MSRRPVAYIALQQFSSEEEHPQQILREAGFEIRQNMLGRRLRAEDMAEALREADAVLAGVEPYEESLLTSLPRLRCISRCGVGTDSIDLKAAERHRIAVYRTPEEVVEPVAQLTVAMILALARQLPLHVADVREGLWKKRMGFALSEWTIGLVGFGRVGRMVERYLRVFGPRVIITDPHIDLSEIPDGVERHPLPALLAASDLISLHAERPRDAGPLIGPDELAGMKPGSYLVNTARGHLIDESALADALQSGHLAGAALDVFETEPYAGPLTRLPQVLCTPHVATLTRASRAAMELRCAQHVVDHFAKRHTDAAVQARRP